MSAAAPYIITWVFCILIGGSIGNSKGQGSAGLWLAVLLGPLGVLIIILTKPTIEVQAQRAEALDAARAQLRAQTAPQPVDVVPPVTDAPADPWGDSPMRRRTT